MGRFETKWLSRPENFAALADPPELDRLDEDLAGLGREIAQAALDDPAVKRLLTITGVNLIVAAGLVAAIGAVRRFCDPQKLVSYVGLNPRVRQSRARADPTWPHQQARTLACPRDAGQSGLGWPRRQARCALSSCASVPVAATRLWRSPSPASWPCCAGTCWPTVRITNGHAQRWSRASCGQWSGKPAKPARKGNKRGAAYGYNIKELRDREIELARHAEQAYERFVSQWQQRGNSARRTGAANEERG